MLLLLLLVSLVQAELNLTFFDVGEGSATLISQGTSHILVDTGNPVAAPLLVRKVKKLTGGKLQALIITHPHQDHIGGVFQFLDELKPRFRFDNGEKITKIDEPYRWFKEEFRKENYKKLKKGDFLKVGKGLIEVLSPGSLASDWNENSLVLKVTYNNKCAVLMSDALKKTESKIGNFECEVIQIGHHGSRYASSAAFVKSVRAKLGIVSVNRNNLRGYPDERVIKRWEQNGIKILKTYELGDIKIKL